MIQGRKQPSRTLNKDVVRVDQSKTNQNAGGDIFSKQVIEFNLPDDPAKPTSSTPVVESKSSKNIFGKINTPTSILSSSHNAKWATPKTCNVGNDEKPTLPSSEPMKMEKSKAKPRKVYRKTLPKMETSSASSSYCVSKGRPIYEEFFESEILQEPSLSISSNSTCQREEEPKEEIEIKVVGIKNVNYDKSKFSGTEQESPRKSPRFVLLTESETEDNKHKCKRLKLTSISMARKNLSPAVFLASLTPPSNEDMAAYAKRKINERKKAVATKWKTEQSTNKQKRAAE